MKFPAISILETPRLQLRKLTLADAEDYNHHLFGSEAVSRYMLWNPHRDVSESVASIRNVLGRYEEGRCYRWGITLKETNELIGMIDLLRFDEEKDSCSFAYMVGECYWGRGYGTEALKAVFAFAFTQMEVKSITADHMAENPASGRVMEKAGMMRTRILPAKYEKNGSTYDAIEYTITQADWNKNCRAGS